MRNSYSPLCLFTYNRLEETKQTVKALKNNFLASESDLFIFSDGPKNEASRLKVEAVRQFLTSVGGFKSIMIFESEQNQGLANSIVSGVSQIIEEHGKVIVLEDDLVTSPNFLNFMNQALDYYASEEKIFSVSGFGHKVELPAGYPYDVFLRGRNYSWGWATWLDRWQTVDWEIKDWKSFSASKQRVKSFNAHGSDLFRLLKGSIEGTNNSWAIRFGYNQFKQGKLTVCPVLSKIRNEGFGGDATHCKTLYNRHKIRFDQTGKTKFELTDRIELIPFINKQLVEYNSVKSRVKTKIYSALTKNGIIKSVDSVEYVTQ